MQAQSSPVFSAPATATSKDVVRLFFDVFSTGDIPAIAECLHDDMRWWVAGSLPGLSGTYDKSQLCTLLGGVAAAYVEGVLPMTVVNIIAEGDRVAVELECSAALHNGRVYANQLHVAIELRDGKLLRVREYMDTAHCYDIFLAP